MTKLVHTTGLQLRFYLDGWIVTLFGAGYFSGRGIFTNAIGSIVGIYIAYIIYTNYMGY